ncbi:MAG: helix-turn-helix transcriptional regulator [Coxiellaceae bacterium]|nr:helix-turn-helix transcriptional regulator [Coxiellaceae bacterium]
MQHFKSCEKLTLREVSCLQYAALDKSLVETAEIMYLSPETIKTYRRRVLAKLGCRTMTAALMIALQSGVMSFTSRGDGLNH